MKGMAKLVKSILEDDRKARNSDYHLWMRVCEITCPESLYSSFYYVLEHHNDLGLPNFESVGRARRKVQELYPHLQSDEKIHEERAKREEEFKEFAREVSV